MINDKQLNANTIWFKSESEKDTFKKKRNLKRLL